MKKIFVFLLLGIFLISFGSAFEFDNVAKEDKDTGVITIKNSYNIPLLTKELATIELYDYQRYCIPSNCYMYMKIDVKESGLQSYKESRYYNFEKTIELSGKKRKIEIRQVVEKTVEYEECSNSTGSCITKQKTIYEELWATYDINSKLSKGTHYLREKVDIIEGETLDIVPNFYGIEISQWAPFTGLTQIEFFNAGDDSFTEGAQGTDERGQTFTIGTTGPNETFVTGGISLKIYNAGGTPGIINISIKNVNGSNLPTGDALVSVLFDASGISSSTSNWENITIGPTELNPGQTYAITLGCPACNSSDKFGWRIASGGGYAGGNGVNFNGVWSSNSDDRLFEVWGSQKPITNLLSPTDNQPGLLNEVNFTCEGIATVGTITNMSLYTNETGTFELRNITTGLSSVSVNESWNRTFSEGDSMIWSCESCSSNGECSFASENRSIAIDTTPPAISITAPTGILDFNIIGSNETINVTFTDANLDTCLYDYNGTNVTITSCVSGVPNIINFTLEENLLNITFFANDTALNSNSSNTEWTYFVLQNSQTFTTTVLEGSTELFSLNYTANETPTSANFIYNGSLTSADIDASNFPNVIISESIIIPSTDTSTNVSFFWNIISLSSDINTTTTNQTITSLALDNCTSFTNVLFNYTMVDESSQVVLNGSAENVSLEIDISVFSSNRDSLVINFSTIFTGTNPNSICSETSLLNGSNFVLDSIAKYSSAARAIEYYNIRGFEINNQTTIQEITLFDILDSESTAFQITFKNSDFVVVEEALISVNRQFVEEGVFKTVEIPITDSNGQTVVHLIKNDIVYNFIVTKGGEIIGTFNNLIAFCEDETIGQCFIPLNALQGTETTFNPDEDLGVTGGFDFNETTRDLVFTFTTTDGSVKTVLLSAVKMDQLGNTSVCSSSLTSASGTITCNVAASLGNETIITSIFVEGQLKLVSYFSADNDIFLGDGGYFLLLFLVISLGLMFSESKSMMVAGIILGFVAGGVLFLIEGGIVGTGSAVMWLIIMGMILIWKLQSEGQT